MIHIYEKILSWGLRLYLFLLPWPTIWMYREPVMFSGKWEYGVLGYYLTELFLWGCVSFSMLWLWQRMRKNRVEQSFSWGDDRVFVLSMMGCVLYAGISSLWAFDSALAIQQTLRFLLAGIFFVLLIIGPISLTHIVQSFVGGMFVQSILGLYQFFTQSTFSFVWLGLVAHGVSDGGTSVLVNESGRWLRAYGAFSHPNVFGGFLAVSIGVTLCFLLLDKNAIRKWYMHIVLGIHVAALFVSWSRSAWIAVALMSFVVGVLRISPQRKKYLLTVVGIPLCFTALYVPLVETRLFGGSTYEVQSIEERVDGIYRAREIIRDHRSFGVGAGNYTRALQEIIPGSPGWMYQPVHMVPVLFLAEFGFFGVGLFFVSVWCFMRLFIRRGMWLWITAAVVIGPLLLFDHYLYSSYQGMMLGAMSLAFLVHFSTDEMKRMSFLQK